MRDWRCGPTQASHDGRQACLYAVQRALDSKLLMESKPMSRPLPTEMYSTNLVRAPRSVWLYPANTSSEMWNALCTERSSIIYLAPRNAVQACGTHASQSVQSNVKRLYIGSGIHTHRHQRATLRLCLRPAQPRTWMF